ncbi:hypothetical protein N7501_005816 [Penicillium viridicatum]|nr:hypothetical protein N7501_005816 [Penicillium viridicatum]
MGASDALNYIGGIIKHGFYRLPKGTGARKGQLKIPVPPELTAMSSGTRCEDDPYHNPHKT